MAMSLNSVSTVYATSEPDVFNLACNITDFYGETYDTQFCSRPEDPFGLNPDIRAWLAANPDFPIEPYVPPEPPTADEIRASMPALSRYQFRAGMKAGGITTAVISDAIDAVIDPDEREDYEIFWESSQVFNRLDAFTLLVSASKTPEQTDAIWQAAYNI